MSFISPGIIEGKQLVRMKVAQKTEELMLSTITQVHDVTQKVLGNSQFIC